MKWLKDQSWDISEKPPHHVKKGQKVEGKVPKLYN